MQKRILQWAVTLLVPLLATACATTDYATGSAEDTLIAVQYGEVSGIEQVPLKTDYAAGTLLGGGLGLLGARHRSTGTQVAATVVGALIGALVQNAAQGGGTANKYTVTLNDGRTVSIVSEHHDIDQGDCVSIEQGRHANIRRVASAMCGVEGGPTAYHTVHAATVKEARECHQVKEELLAARTEQQADVAYRKMRAFCEH